MLSLGDAPLMRKVQTLVLDIDSDQKPSMPERVLLDLSGASLLHDLWIRDQGSPCPNPLILPPISCNITRLHLEGTVDPASVINLINSCERLKALDWSNPILVLIL